MLNTHRRLHVALTSVQRVTGVPSTSAFNQSGISSVRPPWDRTNHAGAHDGAAAARACGRVW
jgi:hypothetical protein